MPPTSPEGTACGHVALCIRSRAQRGMGLKTRSFLSHSWGYRAWVLGPRPLVPTPRCGPALPGESPQDGAPAVVPTGPPLLLADLPTYVHVDRCGAAAHSGRASSRGLPPLGSACSGLVITRGL